jgi:hypothetical protein
MNPSKHEVHGVALSRRSGARGFLHSEDAAWRNALVYVNRLVNNMIPARRPARRGLGQRMGLRRGHQTRRINFLCHYRFRNRLQTSLLRLAKYMLFLERQYESWRAPSIMMSLQAHQASVYLPRDFEPCMTKEVH